ncbi:ATP-binding protein [Microcoleus sp. LEGE 07076]|uniref:ATP-binding protein n=1 Tax=Microcoleus sp. LEGE 07076 TaxID=915322 RepID=UPI001880B7F9|nr:ATP-binding protein [Microcoleus sp. LEGE 07076]MBE9186501.1 ATP-binding protein [Microcoleus sp. LEGE 07076]
MTTHPVSSLEDLNAALLSQNPFAKPPFLNASDVWGNEFFDVETINAHASDAAFHALDQIRTGQYSTTSIAITAQDGTGKTHIISRIRHRLQAKGGGLFVYANKYGDFRQIKQGFQRILAESLGKIGCQGVKQWQELATAMSNDALKAATSNPKIYSPPDLVKKFKKGKPSQVKKWIKDLTKTFLQAKDVSDPDIVKAILWTLSDDQSLYAIKWLEGQELAQYKSNELELPSQRQSFDAVLQILDLISEYNELVICFDELDTPDAYDDISGLHLSQIVAGLIKDLLQNLNRGLILSVMMPAQWSNKIKQLPGGVSTKVSAYGNPIDLKYMDAESIVNLVGFWLDKYYQLRHLIALDRIYPFNQIQLAELGKAKPTVREVLKWCKDRCKPPILNPSDSSKAPDISNPVEIAFIKELEEDVENSLEDNYMLADAILFGFQSLIGQTVERVTVQSATDKVNKRGGKDDYINFKVIGKDNGKDVIIGVAVLQYAGGRGLGAGLRRLNDYEAFNLTRGCLVRSQSKKITSYLEEKYLVPLIKQQGGEYVPLKEDEIKPLLAIRAVHQKRDVDYGVSEEQIFNFIAEKGAHKMLGASNPLLKEILSDPSYNIPTDLIEDELVTVAESIMADRSDSEELDEACENLLSEFN